ncbi:MULTISPECIES: MlaD family protein [Campylobacter]|uniref:MlaD family protein n=1 Tax=Campylobacter TaxID=194 RepID=UPI000A336E74|nr:MULTISPECIES: MlaD family protein [unclassified Campylobacter]MBE6429264.1 MCE family protein [Campylobacter sp.]
MENKNSYFIAGLFFCLVVGFIGLFLLFMQGYNSKDKRDYYILTKELPNGVKKDTEVRFIGVPIGHVKDIYFSDPSSATIEICLSVDANLPIKVDSQAIVERSGISGIAHINITKGSDSARIFNKNERAQISLGEGLLDKIGSRTANLAVSLDKIANKIDLVLKDENLDKLLNSIDRLNAFMNTIASDDNLIKINEFISNLHSITQDIKSANLAQVLANLDKTINDIDVAWNNIDKRIQDGQIDFKSMLSPTLNSAQQSIDNLNDLLLQIKNNLNNLEDNPYEFFFKNREN